MLSKQANHQTELECPLQNTAKARREKTAPAGFGTRRHTAPSTGKSESLGPESGRRLNLRRIHAEAASRPGVETKVGVGLWIDHRKAVIVSVTVSGSTTTLLLSHAEKQPGRKEGIRSTVRYESQLVPADDRRLRRYTSEIGRFYDAVIARIGGAQPILVFGPGKAKGELRRRLARNQHDSRTFCFEVAGKLTGPQITARTKRWLAARRIETPPEHRNSGRPVR